MASVINIKKINLVYEDGSEATLTGESATSAAKAMFSGTQTFNQDDWELRGGVPKKKGLLRKILNFIKE